jgi:putative nucleotidyltransferase with HDIG domain
MTRADLDAARSGAERARYLAREILMDTPERWRHTIGVAKSAARVVGTLSSPGDREALLAAAWLHDIGYAAALRETGFHPIDGARHLEALGWPSRVTGLVAHHSAAVFVAQLRGLGEEIARFQCEDSPVSDALVYADQTVGPNGRVMSFDERLADMLRRHGPASANAAVNPRRAPVLGAAVQRVEQRLRMGHESARRRGSGPQPPAPAGQRTSSVDDSDRALGAVEQVLAHRAEQHAA